MRIRGYSYDADEHCIACARKRFAKDEGLYPLYSLDENNIPVHQTDSEGNEIHPIFSSDERAEGGDYCGDCGEELS